MRGRGMFADGHGVSVCNAQCICCAAIKDQIHAIQRKDGENQSMAEKKRSKPMGLEKRAAPTGAAMNVNPMFDDPDMGADLPSLYAFLHDVRYTNGDARMPGSVSLFNKLGSLIAAVNDNDRQLVAYVSMPTLAELLAVIDEGICNDSLAWKGKTPAAVGKIPPY